LTLGHPLSHLAVLGVSFRRTYTWSLISATDNQSLRPWKEIARELAEQTDPEKICELSHELNQALEKQVGEKWQDYLKTG
jgi:hypothetical protein